MRTAATTWVSCFLQSGGTTKRRLSFTPRRELLLRLPPRIDARVKPYSSLKQKGIRRMPATDTPRTLEHPRAPRTLEESGLNVDLVLQLALKTLHLAGELGGSEIARRLGVRFQVVEPALDLLKAERHCEIVGGSMIGSSAYRYRITDSGRVRAAMFLEQNHYVGKAPVPLEQYRQYMKRFGHHRRVGVT